MPQNILDQVNISKSLMEDKANDVKGLVSGKFYYKNETKIIRCTKA